MTGAFVLTAAEKLRRAREAAKAAGWTAETVRLTADERAVLLADYAADGA